MHGNMVTESKIIAFQSFVKSNITMKRYVVMYVILEMYV